MYPIHSHRRNPAAPPQINVKLTLLPWMLGVCAALGASSVSSAPPSAQADVASTLKHTIETRFANTHVLDVRPSDMPGIYEIYMGDQIVYADATGAHVLMGPLVDTQTHQNLTEARLNELGKIKFSSLPLDRAIKVVKGNGRRQFAVFSDPDCPYCQQLEKSLLSVTDVTMYVFLYPIPSLHPQASPKAHAIWCAKDRTAAWNQWMQEKKLPSGVSCTSDPLPELQRLGDQLHINATPTLFFSDGRRIAGAVPTADLEKALDESSHASPGSAAAGS